MSNLNICQMPWIKIRTKSCCMITCTAGIQPAYRTMCLLSRDTFSKSVHLNVMCTLYTVHSTYRMYTVHSTCTYRMYAVHCTLYIPYVRCTVYTVMSVHPCWYIRSLSDNTVLLMRIDSKQSALTLDSMQ